MLGFLLGVFLCQLYLEQDYLRLLFFFSLAIFFWIWNGKIALILLVFLGAILGACRFQSSFDSGNLFDYLGRVEIRACIETEVDLRLDAVKYTLDAKKILVDRQWRPISGKFLVNAAKYPLYHYGDCLLVKGEMQKPEPIEDFAYDKFLARYDIYAVIYRADLSLLPERSGYLFFESVYRFKNNFERSLGRIFSEPQGSFMAGLILGSRKGIPPDLMSYFNTTGLTHIIAISGYNITLLIVIIGSLLSFLSRKTKIFVSVLVIFIFVVLVGMSAAVVRAAIMGVIGLLALWFGRIYLIDFALIAAAFSMALWNPKILVYDVGFQLSFLATCGLVYVAPLIKKWFLWLPEFVEVREAATMTVAAQIMALPVILLNFGRLSLISPLANIFVLPFIPLAMIFGFFAVVASYFSAFLSKVLGFFGFLILQLIIVLVKFFANFPFAAIDITWLNFWFVSFYFLALLLWIRRCR